MKKNKLEMASQLVGLIVQGFAIIVFFITVLLVFDRHAVCSFYEIPPTYSSLDPVSIIPLIPFLLPILIISIAIIRDSEEYLDEEEFFDEVIKDSEGFFDKVIKASKGFFDKVVSHLNDKSAGFITKSIIDIGIAFIFIIIGSILCNKYKFSAQILIDSSKFLFCPLIYKSLCMLAYMISWIAVSNSIIHIKHEYYFNKRALEAASKDGASSAIVVKGKLSAVRIKLVAMICVLLLLLTSYVNMTKITVLTSKKNYGIVEIGNEKGTHLYAIVLDLDQYYVLEPIEEDGEEITISTERYIYKERDSVEVTQRFFQRVYMNWYTESVPSDYKQ